MNQNPKRQFRISGLSKGHLFLVPLIIAGGRLVGRIVLNLWNMFES